MNCQGQFGGTLGTIYTSRGESRQKRISFLSGFFLKKRLIKMASSPSLADLVAARTQLDQVCSVNKIY